MWLACYTPRRVAEAALGFEWPEYDRWGLERSDSFSLVVFADKGAVVRVEQLKRGDGEFVQEVSAVPFTPATAAFKVIERQQVHLLAPIKSGGV